MMTTAADGGTPDPPARRPPRCRPLAAGEVVEGVRPGTSARRGASGRRRTSNGRCGATNSRAPVAPHHDADRRPGDGRAVISGPDAGASRACRACGGGSRRRTSRRSWRRPTAWRPRRSRAWSDADLRAACRSAKAAHERGVDIYIADFIPFAHGARLFGSAYNDVPAPRGPLRVHRPAHRHANAQLAAQHRAGAAGHPACATGTRRPSSASSRTTLPSSATPAVLALPARRRRVTAMRCSPWRAGSPAARQSRPRRFPTRRLRARRFIEAHPEAQQERRPRCLNWGAPAGVCATTTTCTSAASSDCWRRRSMRRGGAAGRSTTTCSRARSRCRRRWGRRLGDGRTGPRHRRRPPACVARRARSWGSPPGRASPSAQRG